MTVNTEIQKPINPYIVAMAVLLPSFLALAASSATNVCQPNIAGFYGATQYEANTVITCYIISGGIMLPVTGYLVQAIGKKLLMIYSIWLFCFGCLLCILAPNLQAMSVWLYHHDEDWRKIERKQDEDADIPTDIEHGINIDSWIKDKLK